MKVHTSIPFDQLSGMAGDVVARGTKYGIVLSGRPRHSKVATPSQKEERALLARAGQRYKSLTAGQVEAWRKFAPKMGADMAPVNAFIRLGFMRSLLGLEICSLPPVEVVQVPALAYRNIYITPKEIIISGIVRISDRYRLAVRISKPVSNGVSYGRNLPVIVDSGHIPDIGIADLTRIYTEKLGAAPQAGQRYFLQLFWVDYETGFTGPKTEISKLCIES